MLDQIVSHEPSHIFWSGDNTAHDDPFVSQAEVDVEVGTVASIVGRKLGDRDMTVALGNHDAFPNGQWDFKTRGPTLQGRDDLK